MTMSEFANLMNVSERDASLFVGLVASGLKQGKTLEDSIEAGRVYLAQVLANIQNNPTAARAFVASLYHDLRARAAQGVQS